MEASVTFDGMPKMLLEIHQMLKELLARPVQQQSDEKKSCKWDDIEWLNINDLIEFLPNHPTKMTIYNWTSRGLLPSYKRQGEVFYNKEEIEDWIREGRRKTRYEIEKEADERMNAFKK